MIYIIVGILIIGWLWEKDYCVLWSIPVTLIWCVGVMFLSTFYVKPNSYTNTQYIYSLSRDMRPDDTHVVMHLPKGTQFNEFKL